MGHAGLRAADSCQSSMQWETPMKPRLSVDLRGMDWRPTQVAIAYILRREIWHQRVGFELRARCVFISRGRAVLSAPPPHTLALRRGHHERYDPVSGNNTVSRLRLWLKSSVLYMSLWVLLCEQNASARRYGRSLLGVDVGLPTRSMYI